MDSNALNVRQKKKSWPCPNCGQNTTNGENGDYCLPCQLLAEDQAYEDRDRESD